MCSTDSLRSFQIGTQILTFLSVAIVRERGEQDIFSSAHFYFSMFNILLIMRNKNGNIFLLKARNSPDYTRFSSCFKP